MSNINPYDASQIGWREAVRAKKLRPHPPTIMQSLESHGPIKDFICPVCRQFQLSSSALTPICYGGSS